MQVYRQRSNAGICACVYAGIFADIFACISVGIVAEKNAGICAGIGADRFVGILCKYNCWYMLHFRVKVGREYMRG